MNAPILLAVIALVFGIAPILMGSNAVYILLALCAGELLAKLVATDVTQVINSIIALNVPMYSIVQIVLLVIAPVILLLTFRKGIKSAKIVMQIIPALAAVILCFMLVVAKLPYDLQNKIQDSNVFSLVKPYFGLAIAAGLLASVLYLWTKRPKHHLDDKKSHKKVNL